MAISAIQIKRNAHNVNRNIFIFRWSFRWCRFHHSLAFFMLLSFSFYVMSYPRPIGHKRIMPMKHVHLLNRFERKIRQLFGAKELPSFVTWFRIDDALFHFLIQLISFSSILLFVTTNRDEMKQQTRWTNSDRIYWSGKLTLKTTSTFIRHTIWRSEYWSRFRHILDERDSKVHVLTFFYVRLYCSWLSWTTTATVYMRECVCVKQLLSSI